MARIERAKQAIEDIVEIWMYIAVTNGNPSVADRLVHRFDEVLRLLSQQPEAGVSIAHVSPDIRTFSIGNYVIFYRPLPDGVRLIRVLHGARKWDDILESGAE
jgi:toxin ParE1/3/4